MAQFFSHPFCSWLFQVEGRLPARADPSVASVESERASRNLASEVDSETLAQAAILKQVRYLADRASAVTCLA